MIIDRLNNIMINYEKFFKTMERILDSYNINNINYNILNNVNNIVNLFKQKISNEIFSDVQKFVADNKFEDFIPKMLNIYNKINKNEIDLVYNIPSHRKNVKLFGEEFVENNKYLCKIILENNEYELTDYFDLKNIKGDKLKIKLKGINNVTDLCDMFRDCSYLSEESDFSNWDTRYVVTMAEFFYNCKFEKIPDISNFDTRNVVDMNYLFGYCSSLKSLPDISKWNTSKVSYMLKMFVECSSLKYLPEIEKWDLTNVKKLKETESMFEDCKSLKIPDKFLEFK
jgi:surface protein